MEEDYSLKPFHYPAALLSRSTIVSFIGGIAALVALGILAHRRKIPIEILLIAVYVFGFVLMMTLGAKKGDRYIVPAFFALDILAAFGIVFTLSFYPERSRGVSKGGFLSLLTSPSPSFVRRGIRRFLPFTKGELEGVSRSGAIVGLLSTVYLLIVVISYHPYAVAYSNPLFPDNLSQELGWGEGLDKVAAWLNENHPESTVASWYPEELDTFTSATVAHINAHRQNQVEFIVLYKNMFGREPSHYANDFIDEYYKKEEPVFTAQVHGKDYAWVYAKPSYANTVGDLNAETIVVQEIAVSHNDIAGFDILPATRNGVADKGTLVVTVSKQLAGTPIFTAEVPVSELSDKEWESFLFPEGVAIAKGDHLFITMRVSASQDPYASVRYARQAYRETPVYISRTGVLFDAEEKPGSLGVRATYHAIDGTIATELQVKLLR